MKWTEFSFMLKPSPLGGIGVFATHDIPSGTLLFNQNSKHLVRTLKIKDLPAEALKYCVLINDEECFCPERFDRMEIGWYLNHSAEPNIAKKDPSQIINTAEDFYNNREKHQLYSIKDIKAGDEILMDYNELNEPEALKEDYYKQSKG